MESQNRKEILLTPLVRIFQAGDMYYMEIACKDGSVIEHEPFRGLEGLVTALSLSAEICAGKFYLSKVLYTPQEKPTLEFKKKTKGGLA